MEILNELNPGFRRLVALLINLVFLFMRRVPLEVVVDMNVEVPPWLYLWSREMGL